MPTSTPSKNSHIIGGYITGQSAKAVCIKLVQVDGVEVEPEKQKDHWFPFSQVSSIYKNREPGGEFDTLTATHWICQQKELV
jgi:hypothetical protein